MVDVNPDELSKTGGVVVPHSLGVAPSLEDGVGLDDLVLKGGLALLPLARGADGGKVGNDLLGVLSLSGSRLSGDEDRLVDPRIGHALVGALSDCKDVGETLEKENIRLLSIQFYYLGPPLANVHLHGAEGVDGEPLVRVDGDAEEARVGVDELGLVSHHRVPEDASVTKESQVGHILRHVKLGRVDLDNLFSRSL